MPCDLNNLHGILVLNKPKGFTSAELVYKIKRKFKLKKVGHGGTLDPLATGILAICINRGTKMAGQLLESDKIYEGSYLLGIETDTHDMTGKVVNQKEVSVADDEILQAMAKYVGKIQQMPPMYSAIKKNGMPLYRYARANQTVERETRLISIFEFCFLGRNENEVFFRVHCSKGTYVRTLCHDLGKDLGVGASLNNLTRVKSGRLHLNEAIEFDALNADNFIAPPHWKSIEFLRT